MALEDEVPFTATFYLVKSSLEGKWNKDMQDAWKWQVFEAGTWKHVGGQAGTVCLLWCILVCHPHLTIILCCTAVWAQACGLDHKNKFRHFLSSLVHSASASVFTSLSVCWWCSITILLLMVHFIRTVATVTIPVLVVLVNT